MMQSEDLRVSVTELLETKTREALAIALKSRNAEEHLADRNGLVERLAQSYGSDSHGFDVSWEIQHIEETPESCYDATNILDAQGLRFLSERLYEAKRKTP